MDQSAGSSRAVMLGTTIHPGSSLNQSPRRITATSFFSSPTNSSPSSFFSAISTAAEAEAKNSADEHELVSCSSFSASQTAKVLSNHDGLLMHMQVCGSGPSSAKSGTMANLPHMLQGQPQEHQQDDNQDDDSDDQDKRRGKLQRGYDRVVFQGHIDERDRDHDHCSQRQQPQHQHQQLAQKTPIQHPHSPTTNCLFKPLQSSASGALASHAAACASSSTSLSMPAGPSTSLALSAACPHSVIISSTASELPSRRYKTNSTTVESLDFATILSVNSSPSGSDNSSVGDDSDAIVPSLELPRALSAQDDSALSDVVNIIRIRNNNDDPVALPSSALSQSKGSARTINGPAEPLLPSSFSPSLHPPSPGDLCQHMSGPCSIHEHQLFYHLALQQQHQQHQQSPIISSSTSTFPANLNSPQFKGNMADYSVSSIPSSPILDCQMSPRLLSARYQSVIVPAPVSSAIHSPSTSITWASPSMHSRKSPILAALSERNHSKDKGKGKGKGKGKKAVRGYRSGRRQAIKACFDALPREVKIHIFRYLTTFQLVRVSRVSRVWRSIAMDGSLWKVIDTTRYYKNIHDDQLWTLGTAASGFLRYANFRGCAQLSPRSLRAIAEHCPNVERLNLTGCRSVSSKSIADVCMNMPSLLDLDLSGLQAVNNFTLQAIAVYCRSLQVLNLAWCKQISGTGLTKLTRNCQDLRKLNVSGCTSLEDRWMPVIGMNLPKLRELCLNSCSSLTDRGLIGLLSGLSVASSKKYRKWRMKKRMASSVRVSSLGHLLVNQSSCNDDDDDEDDDQGEDELDFENDRRDDSDPENNPEDDADDEDGHSENDGQQGSSNINTDTAQSSIQNQEEIQARLVYLGLSNCRLLTQEALRAIGHYCKRHLRRLELSSCENLSDEGLVFLAQYCTRLRYLDLEEVSLLTDTSLRAFGIHLQKLERISLSYCENVTDQGIMRMLRPAPNPTTLSTANNDMLLSNSETATQPCSKLIHLELDNCLLITDRLLLEFAIVLEERKAAAMERQKERERKREERRERIRQKARKNEEEQRNNEDSAQDPSPRSSYDQSMDSLRTDELTYTSSPVSIPARFRHKPELASGSTLSYSSSPLQPRSVLASTFISEEVAIKKTRAGMSIMVPTRSHSTTSTSSTSSSSISAPLWSGTVPSSRMHLNGKRDVRTRVKKPAQPTIQVFDCRNITLEGVEAAQARCPVLAVKSYYSWSHPSTAAPITSAFFGSDGDAEGLYDEGNDEEDDGEDADTINHNNNNSQNSLHHLQLQQQHFQQQLQRRGRAASLLYRARLGLIGHAGGSQDAQCPIL